MWQTLTGHLWWLLGAFVCGGLLGSGWRSLGVRRHEREQAQFFQSKVDAAVRESDERGLRVKTAEARLAMLEPLEGQLRLRDRALSELSVEVAKLRALPPAIVEKVVAVDAPVAVQAVGVAKVAKVAAEAVERVEGASAELSADDLKLIRGVGPKLAEFLNQRGVMQFRQVALWTDADIDRFEAELPRFRGRIRREGWVECAAEQHQRKYRSDL
jgi:predicted flap endonuclease-1-like 5' DNA nuclease